MLYIQNLLQNIAAAHENFRTKVPSKARFGIIAGLAIMTFIILIFKAEFLMTHMIALLPVFYVSAVLAVGFKRALYGTAVFLFFYFALWLRTGPPYQGVMGGGYVSFAENDGWYNMRLVENLVHHFPVRNSFEPYTLYPYGQNVPFAPFFDWFLALIIWIAGLGHPSTALIEKIGAYSPAILGASTVIPVYFIGKELFNRNAGLLAAGLLSILPGEFLFRSILGFTDHHVAEALFSTTTMLFFILAVKRAQEAQLTLGQIKHREWSSLKKPLLFALLAGFSLGIYILSWIGAAIFIFIMLIYFTIQYQLDHQKGKSTDYLFIVSLPILLIALLMAAAFHDFLFYSATVFGGLIIGLLWIAVLQIISRIMVRKNVRRIYYPITAVIIGLVVVGFLRLVSPSLFQTIIVVLKTLLPNSQSMTVMEAQPLLTGLDMSNLTNHRIWTYFTTGLIMLPAAFLIIVSSAMRNSKIGKWSFFSWLGIVVLTVIIDQMTFMPWQMYMVEGLVIMALYVCFEKSSANIILVLWSFVTLLALLSQTRYAYYYAINVALLSSYILWKMPEWISSSFRLSSKSWMWSAGWIAPVIITLIIDKTTFISVPSIMYIIEGIAIIAWIAYKALSPGLQENPIADKRRIRAAKKRGEALVEQTAARYLKPKYLAVTLSIIVIFSLTVYPNLIYGTYDHNEWSPKQSALYSSHITRTVPT
jgi:oligosaccharyl transferase (archaeosortase A-associated)